MHIWLLVCPHETTGVRACPLVPAGVVCAHSIPSDHGHTLAELRWDPSPSLFPHMLSLTHTHLLEIRHQLFCGEDEGAGAQVEHELRLGAAVSICIHEVEQAAHTLLQLPAKQQGKNKTELRAQGERAMARMPGKGWVVSKHSGLHWAPPAIEEGQPRHCGETLGATGCNLWGLGVPGCARLPRRLCTATCGKRT